MPDIGHIRLIRTHDKRAGRTTCPDCRRRSPYVSFYEAWYGWTTTCMRCGRQWADGEWLPLPFYRYARRDNIAAARRRWKRDLDPLPEREECQ